MALQDQHLMSATSGSVGSSSSSSSSSTNKAKKDAANAKLKDIANEVDKERDVFPQVRRCWEGGGCI